MRTLICGVSIVVLMSPALFANTPATALVDGRARLASGDCNGAIGVFQNAIPDATALQPEKARSDALAALHFYTALAFSNCNFPAKAKEEVREFLRFHPGFSALDANKFPRGFIALFEEVQNSAADHGGPTAFSHYYSDYNSYAQIRPNPSKTVVWGSSAEFQLFADAEERDKWHTLLDDDARQRFIDAFWTKRDPDPATPENEFRDEVLRRIAFADRVFGNGEVMRGSLSDRGRVFVFLGAPARVYQKPLTRGDGAFIPSRSPIAIDGVLERWVYFKPQLPGQISTTDVQFRFISQAGYGDHVMQKDFWALKALAEAQKSIRLMAE